MAWIFALGILGFAIFHEGFRKVCFWIGGVIALGVFIAFGVATHQEEMRKKSEAIETAAFDKKYGSCGNEKPFDPDLYVECQAAIDAKEVTAGPHLANRQ